MLLDQGWVVLPLAVLLLWQIILSFFLYKTVAHYRRLTKGVTKDNLGVILEKILKEQEKCHDQIEAVSKRIEGVAVEGKSHLHRVGLVRFNPFSETGGDQSFSLALLDGHKSGFVVSSLHSRESTRIYAKPVKEGKVEGYQSSKEEGEAISKACK